MPLADEINDCMVASVTYLRRLKILCDMTEIPSEMTNDFAELSVDWGDNIVRLRKLLKELE